jgi:hypothetical protein
MPGIEFAEVARLVSCKDVANIAGLVIRHNRIQCPFHGGKDFNFALYPDGRGFCFVCGKNADSVSMAAAVWHIPQTQAADELNQRFRLGLTGETMTQDELERRERARQAARDHQQRERQREISEWGAACEAERAAQQAIEQFTQADCDKPEFDQALQRLCAAQLRCDVLQAARAGW